MSHLVRRCAIRERRWSVNLSIVKRRSGCSSKSAKGPKAAPVQGGERGASHEGVYPRVESDLPLYPMGCNKAPVTYASLTLPATTAAFYLASRRRLQPNPTQSTHARL